ncbi:MAG: isoprenylcysteine carboxylmethyltransferase family protein [Acidobacteriota bacterium]
MTLREEMESHGGWLFRWRSYLPLCLLPLVLIALSADPRREAAWGDLTDDIVKSAGLGLALLGLLIRCLVAGFVPGWTSGRNTRRQVAASLNTTGMYSLVRHPLYLGNLLITLGLVTYTGSPWLVACIGLAFLLYYERIMLTEEEFLRASFGDTYLAWAARVPCLLPRGLSWVRPALPFCVRTLLRRETTTAFVLVAAFTFIAHGRDLIGERRFELEAEWLVPLALTGLLWWTTRFLRKRTQVLAVEGR